LPEFTYDPHDGHTFDVWFYRYEDVIGKDGPTLDKAARTRLIVRKLGAASYALFTGHLLPKRASELCYDETVKTMKEQFGRNMSAFVPRYTYLRTQRNGDYPSDYTGMVNRRNAVAE
ncbi:hypothetical protein Tcan_01224, partial [Toxocara canis]